MIYPTCQACQMWIENPIINPHNNEEEKLCCICLKIAGIELVLDAATILLKKYKISHKDDDNNITLLVDCVKNN